MLINDFITYLRYELNYSPKTTAGYASDLAMFARDTSLSDDQLPTANDSHIRRWIISLNKQGCTVRTIKRKVQALRAFYRYLLTRGLVSANPAAEIETGKAPKTLPKYVREQNIDRWLNEHVAEDNFTAVRNHLIVLMFYSTGIRREELITLKDHNVDTTTGTLKVLGKRNKERIIPFGKELSQAIEQYRTLRRVHASNTVSNFFIRPTGEPLYPTLVYRIVRRALIESGGSSAQSPHVLRHSFASAMINHGANLTAVKELLGHTSLATTQIYTHISFNELKSNYKLAHPRAQKKGG